MDFEQRVSAETREHLTRNVKVRDDFPKASHYWRRTGQRIEEEIQWRCVKCGIHTTKQAPEKESRCNGAEKSFEN